MTYRDTWPHEYVLTERDAQQDLLAAVCERFLAGEGVASRFFSMDNTYLFIGDHKYWLMTDYHEIDAHNDEGDYVLNRAVSIGTGATSSSSRATAGYRRTTRLTRPCAPEYRVISSQPQRPCSTAGKYLADRSFNGVKFRHCHSNSLSNMALRPQPGVRSFNA